MRRREVHRCRIFDSFFILLCWLFFFTCNKFSRWRKRAPHGPKAWTKLRKMSSSQWNAKNYIGDKWMKRNRGDSSLNWTSSGGIVVHLLQRSSYPVNELIKISKKSWSVIDTITSVFVYSRRAFWFLRCNRLPWSALCSAVHSTARMCLDTKAYDFLNNSHFENKSSQSRYVSTSSGLPILHNPHTIFGYLHPAQKGRWKPNRHKDVLIIRNLLAVAIH